MHSTAPALTVVRPDDDRDPVHDPPRTPIRGALTLTGTQELALISLIENRIESSIGSCRRDGWLEKRRIATAHYAGNFENRRTVGSVFFQSNISLNLPKRYVRITTARGFDELLSSDPFIAVSPEGEEDSTDEAQAISRVLAYKFDEAKIREVFRDAQRAATIRGEGVVKYNWTRRTRRYKRYCRVLLDSEGGRPIICRDGNPVPDTAQWDDDEGGGKVLMRDNRIRLPKDKQAIWSEPQIVTFRHVIFDGLEAALVDYRDFLCNTTERCIHAADFMAFRLDIPIDDIRGMMRPVQHTDQAKEFMAKLEGAANSDGGSENSKPDDQRGETARSMESIPLGRFAEVYIRAVVDPDGSSDEICVLYDTENRQMAAYDYLSNISPTHHRPARVVRIEPVENRWYGTGFYELFTDRHKFCDLFFNRVNFKASMAGLFKVTNPRATEEGMAGEPVEFGTNRTYTLREGYTINDAFGILQIPDDSASSQNLLNMLLQVTQLEAGMVSSGDHGLAGLPSSELATGIKSLERVANALLKSTFHDLIEGFEAILRDCSKIVLRKITPLELENLLGDTDAKIIGRLREVENLGYRVKLQLSNAKDSDVLRSNEQAIQLVMNYHNGVEKSIRPLVRHIFVRILKTLGIEDADKALPLPTKEEMMAEGSGSNGAPVAAGAPGNPAGTPIPPAAPANPTETLP